MDGLEARLRAQEAWLVVSDSVCRASPGSVSVDFSVTGGRVEYTTVPTSVEAALSAILLLDWRLSKNARSARRYWFPGYPPGAFTAVDDDWFRPPGHIEHGQMGFDENAEGFPFPLMATFSCAEIGVLPSIVSQLDTLAADSGNQFVVGRALRFFVKACLVDPYSYPPGKMDQILNLVISLDALAGDDAPGSSGRLATRVAYLAGCTPKEVACLYQARSRIVHGDSLGDLSIELCWNGFDIARKALRASIQLLCDRIMKCQGVDKDRFIDTIDQNAQ